MFLLSTFTGSSIAIGPGAERLILLHSTLSLILSINSNALSGFSLSRPFNRTDILTLSPRFKKFAIFEMRQRNQQLSVGSN